MSMSSHFSPSLLRAFSGLCMSFADIPSILIVSAFPPVSTIMFSFGPSMYQMYPLAVVISPKPER